MQLSGPKLKAQRITAGQSREQVAVAVHRSAQTVMLWELGTVVPNGAQLAALASLYGCHPGDFFEAGQVAA